MTSAAIVRFSREGIDRRLHCRRVTMNKRELEADDHHHAAKKVRLQDEVQVDLTSEDEDEPPRENSRRNRRQLIRLENHKSITAVGSDDDGEDTHDTPTCVRPSPRSLRRSRRVPISYALSDSEDEVDNDSESDSSGYSDSYIPGATPDFDESPLSSSSSDSASESEDDHLGGASYAEHEAASNESDTGAISPDDAPPTYAQATRRSSPTPPDRQIDSLTPTAPLGNHVTTPASQQVEQSHDEAATLADRLAIKEELIKSLKADHEAESLERKRVEAVIIQQSAKIAAMKTELTTAQAAAAESTASLKTKHQTELAELHNHVQRELVRQTVETKRFKERFETSEGKLQKYRRIVLAARKVTESDGGADWGEFGKHMKELSEAVKQAKDLDLF